MARRKQEQWYHMYALERKSSFALLSINWHVILEGGAPADISRLFAAAQRA